MLTVTWPEAQGRSPLPRRTSFAFFVVLALALGLLALMLLVICMQARSNQNLLVSKINQKPRRQPALPHTLFARILP